MKYNKNLKIEWRQSLVPGLHSINKILVIKIKNYANAVIKSFGPVQFCLISLPLREKCPNTEFFTPYLDTFHVMFAAMNFLSGIVCVNKFLFVACPSLLQTSMFFFLSKLQSVSKSVEEKWKHGREVPNWTLLCKQIHYWVRSKIVIRKILKFGWWCFFR